MTTGNGTTDVRTRRSRKRTLPVGRSQRSTYLIWSFASLLLFLSIIFSEGERRITHTMFILFGVLLLVLFVVELFFRILYITEEIHHLNTRYDNSYSTLIKDVFYFPSTTFLLVMMCVFTHILIHVLYEISPFKLWCDMGLPSLLLSTVSVLLLQRTLNLQSGPLYDSLWIENSNGLDYGSGMAHSFFHGYLKLVIPKTGTSEKHLEELMKDYEDEHHVKLEFYKLFILIPKSLYCPTSLKNDDISPSIEESSSLQSKIITVAGVQNRVYKNSVYKIKAEKGKRVYVAAEYATPLKTFKDVVSFNGEHSNYYQKHKNDIVLQFYLTLNKVLKEHENCTNFCELIFYDDKDENGKYKDVGLILLNRIKKLRKGTQDSSKS